MSGRKEFSRLLEEALQDAGTLRERVAALSGEVLAGEPSRIFAAAKGLEREAEDSRAVLERLIAILSRAHLHTLGSAYAALRKVSGRGEDAERLRRLMGEYRAAKAIMGMAASHIDAAIANLDKAEPEGMPIEGGEQKEGRLGALLAKA